MFDDFKKAVLNSYAERKAKNLLSDNLINPTRVKLKNECLDILRNRYDKKDDPTIKAFFDPLNEFSSHEQSIAKFDLDGFQALITFFKRNINIRKEENIKLLAWLINFEPRPYDHDRDYTIERNQEASLNIIKTGDKPEHLLVKKIAIIAATITIVLILGITTYNNKGSMEKARVTEIEKNKTNHITLVNNPMQPTGQKAKSGNEKQCMFWTGESYNAVACDEIAVNATIIALDRKKLDLLRRITRPDTLSKKDLTKTWYVKITVDSIEFYTNSGEYPLNTKKILKPLTQYMLNKYPNGYNIYKKRT